MVKSLDCLKRKLKREKQIYYPEYHFDGELDTEKGIKRVKAYEENKKFYLVVDNPNGLESITYSATPQIEHLQNGEGKIHQENYDPYLIAVEIRKGDNVTKLDLGTSQSSSPRVIESINIFKGNFSGLLAKIYEARTNVV